MAVFGGAHAPEVVAGQQFYHGVGAILVDATYAPGGNDAFAAGGTFEEGGVVAGAVGVGGSHHFFRVGRAQAEEVGHPKAVHALTLREAGDAGERGVELILVGRAGIETYPHDQALTKERIDAVNQTVAMNAIRGEMADVFQEVFSTTDEHRLTRIILLNAISRLFYLKERRERSRSVRVESMVGMGLSEAYATDVVQIFTAIDVGVLKAEFDRDDARVLSTGSTPGEFAKEVIAPMLG